MDRSPERMARRSGFTAVGGLEQVADRCAAQVQLPSPQHDLRLTDLSTYTRTPTCTNTDADIGINIDTLGVYSESLL